MKYSLKISRINMTKSQIIQEMKRQLKLFLAYTRVDGYLRTWILLWLCVRTAATIVCAYVRDIMIIVYSPGTTTAVSLIIYGLT